MPSRGTANFQTTACDLAAFVLEREIDVAGGVALEFGDLAAHAHAAELALQRALHRAGEFRDGVFGDVGGGGVDHGGRVWQRRGRGATGRHRRCHSGTTRRCEGGAPSSPNRWAASAWGNQSRQGRRCKRGWRRGDRGGGGGRVRRGRRCAPCRLQAGRRADPQHPAERAQEAPGLRGGGDEGRHLRLGEQVLQLRAPVGGIRHQPHQPGEAVWQRARPVGPLRPRRRLCRAGAWRGPAPQPARVEAGGDSGEAAGDAAQPRADQDDERPREPPPGNLRGHARGTARR